MSSDIYEPGIEWSWADEARTCATHDESKDVWRSYGNGRGCVQRVSPEGRGDPTVVENPLLVADV